MEGNDGKTLVTRRTFIQRGSALLTLLSLPASALGDVAQALESLAAGNPPVLWLQGLSCSGCSISLLNSEAPDPIELLTQDISLLFHSTLSAATGDVAVDVLNRTIDRGGYFLVVEGAVPAGMPDACKMGGEPFATQVVRAARNSKAVIAVGSCSSYGGIPAAEHNPTGAVGVYDFLKKESPATAVVCVPGCPTHPDWFVGTLVHVLRFGMPELDPHGRPLMFFAKTVHEQCPRFRDYEAKRFAKKFSDDGCLFELGCVGPNTHADCTLRKWNWGANTCIQAGAPCIGCAWEKFARRSDFPLFRQNQKLDRGKV